MLARLKEKTVAMKIVFAAMAALLIFAALPGYWLGARYGEDSRALAPLMTPLTWKCSGSFSDSNAGSGKLMQAKIFGDSICGTGVNSLTGEAGFGTGTVNQNGTFSMTISYPSGAVIGNGTLGL